jgi:hypothetical protein
VVSPLGLTLISLALLWRNADARREQRAVEVAELRLARLEAATARHAALAEAVQGQTGWS